MTSKPDDITTCYERGGQPEWDNNDYQRDFEYWGIDRSQPITLPLTDRSQPMDPNETIPETIPEGQQRVDIGELLIAMKYAIEKMGKRNTHRGILVTAGSVIIHLITENKILKRDIELWKAEPPSLDLSDKELIAQVP